MPFPSPQGTQASVAAMLQVLSDRGDDVELWTYAHGAHSWRPSYRIRRLWDVPRDRSLRSGPSLNKLLLDAQLAARLALSPQSLLFAHHVEAALAALLARQPYVFFAHTDLEHELPLYAMRVPDAWLKSLGRSLDLGVARHATSVAAISPRLAESLGRRLDRRVVYVPTPWSVYSAPDHTRRMQARARLGIALNDDVLLYAGNLDRYQGWEDLVGAIAWLQRARPRVRLLVATESAPRPLIECARQAGVADAIVTARLADETDRGICHDAADLCVIPRRAEGGLPIKLLDALARSVPTVAVERARAGLALTDVVEIVSDDSAEAIGRGALDLLRHEARRDSLRAAGSGYLREQHSAAKFLAAFESLRSRC